MTLEMWITLAILATAIVLFVTEKLRVDVVALGVVVSLMLFGILDAGQALAGFSSTAVLLIASLFIIGGAVLQTGLAAMIGRRILRVAGTSETRLIIVVMLAVAIMSGFMSDTGVVAVMLPAIVTLAASAEVPPSKLLIPMAFGSLFGGAATLIGTPPNIIVTETLSEAGYDTFQFFSFTPMGIIIIVLGSLFMVTIGKRLLPTRKVEQDEQQAETPSELFSAYRLPDNLFRMRIRSTSPLINQTLSASKLGQDFDLNVIEIARPPLPRTVAKLGQQSLVIQGAEPEHIHTPDPDTLLQQNDVLLVQGEGNNVGRASAYWNLAIQPSEETDHDALISDEVGIAEVIIPPRSTILNKTLVDVRFGSKYHLTVLKLNRPDTEKPPDLKETPLQAGDTLLVQGRWKDIMALKKQRRDFIVMGENAYINSLQNRRKAPRVALILIGMLLLMVFGESIGIGTTTAAMLAGLVVVLSGCLTMDEAYEAIDWKSIVLIAGMLPMSTALVEVGLVDLIVATFTDLLSTLSPETAALISIAGLFLITSAFTQVLSNTATAVLIAPIALATAEQLGVSPYAFMMAVAVAASMALASPVASPVNTLVMGAGQYRFGDYIKIGLPLILIMMIASVIMLPLLFPF